MKKVFYILLAASAALFVSCAKDKDIKPTEEPVISEAPIFTGETITFEVNMDVQKETMASLSGLNINWQSGDYIGVATDNSATIVAYAVTPDGENPKKGSVTVDAVAGAKKYYALFKGRLGHSGGAHEVAANDFSMIRFNTETKTFYGNADGDLTVGNQQIAVGSLSSYLWWDKGYPLAMAGVGSANPSGNTLVMRPCLALFKVRIASGSVPAGYYLNTETYTSSKGKEHEHTYSAVRGFNFYQIGSSTIYSSGDFTVSVADDGTLTTESVDNANRGTYRQISQEEKLTADTDYLMCLIPSGVQTTFKIDFLGYSNNSGGLSWDAVYSMSNPAKYTVSPGDYYDLGTLNPLGMKKAANEAADEAADAVVAPITIDGTMTDWNPATNTRLTSNNFASETGNSHFKELKVAYDEVYLYVYIKRDRVYTLWGSNQAYFYMFIDTDNDSTNGVEKSGAKYDYGFYFYPFGGTKGDNAEAAVPGWASSPTTSSKASGFTLGGGISIEFAGAYDASDVELEFKIARSSLGIDKNDIINLCAYGNKSADSSPYTAITGFEIKN